MILSQTNKNNIFEKLSKDNKNFGYMKNIMSITDKQLTKLLPIKKKSNINLKLITSCMDFDKDLFAKNGKNNELQKLLILDNTVNTVSYTLTIRHFKTNTFFIFLSCSGNIRANFSAGFIKLNKKKRKKKPSVYFSMIDFLITKTTFEINSPYFIPVSMHFDNIKSSNMDLIVEELEKYYNFCLIKNFVLKPHNGCRGKKLKRQKKKKIS